MLDLDNISPDYELVWPHQIFAAEATAISSLPGAISEHGDLLLQEAFAGSEPRDDFNVVSAAGLSLFANARDTAQRTHLRDLAKHAPRLASRSRPTPYWSSRNAPTNTQRRPQNRSFKNDWIILVSELFANGYFAKVAGYECPDGESSIEVNAALSREISRRLHISNLWPPRNPLADYSDDDVFYSLVEVLHDLAARPRLRTGHDFNGCRGHFKEGSVATGRAIYRWKVNQLLEESSSPYRLAEEGEDRGRLVRNFDDPRRELLEAAPVTPDPTTTNDVGHAIALFRKEALHGKIKEAHALHWLASLKHGRNS